MLLFAAILAVTGIVLWQRHALAETQRRNAELAGQIEMLSAPAEAISKADPPAVDLNELARLRAEHAELIRLRAEVARLRTESQENAARLTNAPPAEAPDIEKIRSPFAAITTNDIPGRYRLIDTDENGNVTKQQYVVLHPNGTFTAYSRDDGQPTISSSYKWMLYPQGLIFNWMSGMSFFQKVSSRGIYVSVKPDRTQLRVEKLDE
jgi:hypothetical protein